MSASGVGAAHLTVIDNVLFFPRGLNFAHISTLKKNDGAIVWNDDCELSLSTGPRSDSFCVLNGYLPIYLNQSYKIDICINAAFSSPRVGLTQLAGMGDSASGAFLGYDGLQFGMLVQKGGKQRQWVLKVTTPCTASGVLTLRLLDVDHSIPVSATMTVMQLLYTIGFSPSIANAGIRAYVCFDRITLRTQESSDFSPAQPDSFDFGATGGSGSLSVVTSGNAAIKTWVYRSDFNAPYRLQTDSLDLTDMNVYQLTFSRWSSACINLSVLNTNHDVMSPLHSMRVGSAGFNTSIPYIPRVLIRKGAEALEEDGVGTVRTSMASASSGTPSTATNVTWFNTNLIYKGSVGNTQNIIGVMTVPLLSGGATNRLTAIISEVRVNVRTTVPVKISLIANGMVDTVIPTSPHLPWSCMRLATPPTPAIVAGGLPASAIYAREEGGEYVVKPEQLWLAPGTNITYSVTRSDGNPDPITCEIDLVALWNEV